MSEKTYVFDGGAGANSIVSALAPMLQSRNIDPSVLAMMNNGFGGNGGWIWIIFLVLLWGG